jgi:hypothetical protein
LIICPNCRRYANETAGFCLFCGKRLSRKGGPFAGYNAAWPRFVVSRAAKARRVLFVLSLLLAAAAVSAILLAPPTARQIAAAGISAPVSPAAPSPAAPPPFDNAFGEASGTYDVTISLSEAESDDPDTLEAAESIRGERYTGNLTLSVDETSAGSVRIRQVFFAPEAIEVSPFTNSEGSRSQNTLYGYALRSGMKLSIVCVCEAGEISGFIWMDGESTHIEFLYFS